MIVLGPLFIAIVAGAFLHCTLKALVEYIKANRHQDTAAARAAVSKEAAR